ncbi:MAG TPA: PAS domain S-box protein, partial [Thermodesulfovibrionales bacterium]|nr:PAS domain S-box protein [Thermodesulfovibrionales bacterium]
MMMKKHIDTIKNDLELFRDLIDRSNDAIFVNDPQSGRFTFVNEKACASLGYDRHELLEMGVMDIEATLPDNFSWQEHVNEVRQRRYLTFEGIQKRKDGVKFPVEVNISFVAMSTREYMVAVVRDVTERRRAENSLREREMQLAESQRIAHLGSWEHNPLKGDIFWSDELFRMLGLDPAKDRADFGTFFARIHPDDQPVLKAAIEKSLREKKPYEVEYRVVIPGEPIKIIRARADLVHDSNGVLSVLRGTAQDITEQKQAEEKIRQSEERYRSLFEDSPISLWEEDFSDLQEHLNTLRSSGITDFRAYFADYPEEVHKCLGMIKIISVNKATLALYEALDQATLLRDLSQVFTIQSFESFRDILIALAEGIQIYECEAVNQTLKGRTINVLLRWSLLSGTVQGCRALISIVDITERKSAEAERMILEAQLLQAQKLESVGRLAGGVAHDFNNMLSVILGYAELIKHRLPEGDPLSKDVEEIQKAAIRSRDITRQLLAFSRQQIIEP